MRVLGIPARRIHRRRTPSTVPFRRRGRTASGCKPLEPEARWRMIRAVSRIPLRRPSRSDRRAGDSAVRSCEAIVQVSDLHNLDGARGPPAQADRKARVPRGRPPNAAAQPHGIPPFKCEQLARESPRPAEVPLAAHFIASPGPLERQAICAPCCGSRPIPRLPARFS